MSVINSMLRDLAANPSHPQTAPTLSATPKAVPTQRRYRPLLWLGLIVFALGIWLLRWQFAANPETRAGLPAAITASTATAIVAPASESLAPVITPPGAPAQPETATAAPPDARPRQRASIGWELVQPDPEPLATDDTGLPPAPYDDETSADRAEHDAAWVAAESPPARPTTRSDQPDPSAEPPAQFSKQPSQASEAEQLAQLQRDIRAALAAHDVTSAGQLLQRARQRWPDDPDLQRLQLDWLAQNDGIVAEQEARRLLDEQTDNWSVRQWLGRQLLQQQQAGAARELLAQHAPALGAQPAYHATLALAEQQAGDHLAAVARYRQLQALQPADGRHSAGLALSLDALRDDNAAAQAWQRALADPRLPAALRRYGQDRLRQLALPSASLQVSR